MWLMVVLIKYSSDMVTISRMICLKPTSLDDNNLNPYSPMEKMS
jgi:hypothetical protein